MNTDDFSSETAGEGELTAKNRAYAILRNRDLRLYLSGRLIAIIGQQMLALAIGWELWNRTHDLMMLSYVGLTQVMPMILFTLPAGHMADNFSRKKIITLMTVVMAASSLGLTLISYYQAPVFLMYVCLFINGATRTFQTAASASFLPSLVDRKDLSLADQLERDNVSTGFHHRARGRAAPSFVGRAPRVSDLRDQYVRPAHFLFHDDANPHASCGGEPGKNVVQERC